MIVKSSGAFVGVLSALLCVSSCGETHSEAETTAPLDRQQSLVMACSTCHAETNRHIPQLAGLPEQALLDALLLYKSDASGTSVMHRLVRGYSESDLELIAQELGTPSS